MQVILTHLFVIILVSSVTLFVGLFIRGLLHTPQVNAIVESSIESVALVVQSPIIPVTEPVVYATLEWVHQVPDTEEAVNEMPDIVQMAKARMPRLNIAGLGIRELKKLASDRKLKGYSNMRKAELIAALC